MTVKEIIIDEKKLEAYLKKCVGEALSLRQIMTESGAYDGEFSFDNLFKLLGAADRSANKGGLFLERTESFVGMPWDSEMIIGKQGKIYVDQVRQSR